MSLVNPHGKLADVIFYDLNRVLVSGHHPRRLHRELHQRITNQINTITQSLMINLMSHLVLKIAREATIDDEGSHERVKKFREVLL